LVCKNCLWLNYPSLEDSELIENEIKHFGYKNFVHRFGLQQEELCLFPKRGTEQVFIARCLERVIYVYYYLVQLGPIHTRDLNVSRAVHISTFLLGSWLDGHESNDVICLCALLQTF
jgi:hypothetical protein